MQCVHVGWASFSPYSSRTLSMQQGIWVNMLNVPFKYYKRVEKSFYLIYNIKSKNKYNHLFLTLLFFIKDKGKEIKLTRYLKKI